VPTPKSPRPPRKEDTLLRDIDALVERAIAVEPKKGKTTEIALGFFDLAGSTALKIEEGHFAGVAAAQQHNRICEDIGSRFTGRVVKSLGDGLLMTFDSSIDAALTAVNAVYAMQHSTDLQTKVGLTTGTVEHITIHGQPDIMGSAVDRCARLQALADPSEIIVDEAFYSSAQSLVTSYRGLRLTGSQLGVLKGIGEVRYQRLELH
jgi:class 3 adenylate cyclase